MSKLSEYYLKTCIQHEDSNKLFIKWNWGAFLFGSIWLLYRGMFLYGLIYFLILFLEVGINYLVIDYYLAIMAFALHILLGMYGTSLFCNKYKTEILDQLNKSKIYLDCPGKKQQHNPSLTAVEESIMNLTKPNQSLILNNGAEFIQTILSEIKNNEKLFQVEYLDSSKNILFESQNLQTLDQTLSLFKLFLFEDKSLSSATTWIDSDIEISKDNSSTNEVNIKTRPILGLLFYIILSNTLSITEYFSQTVQELKLGLPLLNLTIVVKNKFSLDESNTKFESPSFRLIEKKLKTLKQGNENFVVLEEGANRFIQTKLSNINNNTKYYRVEYKLDNANIINIAKDNLTEQQVIQLFYKFYKYDNSFVKDTIWEKFELVKEKASTLPNHKK